MGPLPRLAQQILGAPGYDNFPRIDEDGDQFKQIHQLRTAMVQGQTVDPERGLQG